MNEAHCFRTVLHHFFLIIIDKHTLSHSDEQCEILKRPYTYNNIITQNEKCARTHTQTHERKTHVWLAGAGVCLSCESRVCFVSDAFFILIDRRTQWSFI